ncbi:unnamed protein product [Wuchereria bancrofti]|uniref:Uncharacterized protein n=2 Tax=Wuchereria bancrofti TaxID=6293 RepID=A0A3P7DNG8_WUCBA|nr:unnamed protein product [Wuchereria bancrofti]
MTDASSYSLQGFIEWTRVPAVDRLDDVYCHHNHSMPAAAAATAASGAIAVIHITHQEESCKGVDHPSVSVAVSEKELNNYINVAKRKSP